MEAYDLNAEAVSQLANIRTRGLVQTGDDVMIGGFITGRGDNNGKVLVRAIGPSLTTAGIVDALPDTMLELRDANGALVTSNDDWRDANQDMIELTGLAPSDDRESAILATLPAGAYTAIVSGKGGTGVGLVEAYQLP